MLTFKFQLYPNKNQQEILWKHANKLNNLYNYFLNQRIENYKLNIKISRKDQQKELVSLKNNDSALQEIHSQVLQQIPLRLDKAYKNFFRKKIGFPKFRSCKNFFSICYPQFKKFNIQNNIFCTKQYGKIKFSKSREILGKIKQISITNKNNKFYLNITTDYNKEKIAKYWLK
jgi:putative transposase